MNKIKTELTIIEKIIASLEEVYALNETEDADTIIEALDKEADEIIVSVAEIIENAEKHVQERLDQGEEESVLLSNKSHVNNDKFSWHPKVRNRSKWKQNRPANAFLMLKKAKTEGISTSNNNCQTSTGQTTGRGSTKGGRSKSTESRCGRAGIWAAQ